MPGVVPQEPMFRTQSEPCIDRVDIGVVVPMPMAPEEETVRTVVVARELINFVRASSSLIAFIDAAKIVVVLT